MILQIVKLKFFKATCNPCDHNSYYDMKSDHQPTNGRKKGSASDSNGRGKKVKTSFSLTPGKGKHSKLRLGEDGCTASYSL